MATPFFFQTAVERGLEQPCDLAVCLVDNDETRLFTARHCRDRPAASGSVSEDAGHGHIVVQEPRKACFACIKPEGLAAGRGQPADPRRCPASGAVIDIVDAVAMAVLYAVDSLVMDRPGRWNFRQVVLHGLFPGNRCSSTGRRLTVGPSSSAGPPSA